MAQDSGCLNEPRVLGEASGSNVISNLLNRWLDPQPLKTSHKHCPKISPNPCSSEDPLSPLWPSVSGAASRLSQRSERELSAVVPGAHWVQRELLAQDVLELSRLAFGACPFGLKDL